METNLELPKIQLKDQLADTLIKIVSSRLFSSFLDKLSLNNIYETS